MNWQLVLGVILISFSLFVIYDSHKSYKKDKESFLDFFTPFEHGIAILMLGILLLLFGC